MSLKQTVNAFKRMADVLEVTTEGRTIIVCHKLASRIEIKFTNSMDAGIRLINTITMLKLKDEEKRQSEKC